MIKKINVRLNGILSAAGYVIYNVTVRKKVRNFALEGTLENNETCPLFKNLDMLTNTISIKN